MGQLFNKNESKYLENMVKWKVAKVGYLTLTHFQDSHWSIGQESKNESNGQKVWLIVRQKTVGFNSTLTYTRGGGVKKHIYRIQHTQIPQHCCGNWAAARLNKNYFLSITEKVSRFLMSILWKLSTYKKNSTACSITTALALKSLILFLLCFKIVLV